MECKVLSELSPFRIKTVEGGREDRIGAGSYGAVYHVKVDGVQCIAKRVHTLLVNDQVPQLDRVRALEKFGSECVLLSKLRHPNIVHFVGVHYEKGLGDLSLIMECLDTDLCKFLDARKNIPLSIKLSVLLDVAHGLLYLHSHDPPIVHRDLTASNILLTAQMMAKIADLGVSKLLNVRQHVNLTRVPGNYHYMPPEAHRPDPCYDCKLDSFSFGHLALHVATQQIPEVHDEISQEALDMQIMQVYRRGEAFKKIGKDHPLQKVAHCCLQDSPKKRPLAADLVAMMHRLCVKYPMTMEDIQPSRKDLLSGKDKESVMKVNYERKIVDLERRCDQLHTKNDVLNQRLEQAMQPTASPNVSAPNLHSPVVPMNRLTPPSASPVARRNSAGDAEHRVIPSVERVPKESDGEIRKLQSQIHALKLDVEHHRITAMTYKEDFESERKDREAAYGKMASLQAQHTDELQRSKGRQQSLETDLHLLNSELIRYRERLASADRELCETKHKLQSSEAHLLQSEQEKRQLCGLQRGHVAPPALYNPRQAITPVIYCHTPVGHDAGSHLPAFPGPSPIPRPRAGTAAVNSGYQAGTAAVNSGYQNDCQPTHDQLHSPVTPYHGQPSHHDQPPAAERINIASARGSRSPSPYENIQPLFHQPPARPRFIPIQPQGEDANVP